MTLELGSLCVLVGDLLESPGVGCRPIVGTAREGALPQSPILAVVRYAC